ncbi:MAG: hypothetical protein WAL75_07280 [Terracidiphilus sp.]
MSFGSDPRVAEKGPSPNEDRKKTSIRAKQAAEKLIERSNIGAVDSAGAEARTHLRGFIGPAKAVPLLQSFVGQCLCEFSAARSVAIEGYELPTRVPFS